MIFDIIQGGRRYFYRDGIQYVRMPVETRISASGYSTSLKNNGENLIWTSNTQGGSEVCLNITNINLTSFRRLKLRVNPAGINLHIKITKHTYQDWDATENVFYLHEYNHDWINEEFDISGFTGVYSIQLFYFNNVYDNSKEIKISEWFVE